MTVTWQPVIPRTDTALYDGTNGAALLADIIGATLVSEVSSTLNFTVDGNPYVAVAGDRLMRSGGYFGGVFAPAQWANNYFTVQALTQSFAPPAVASTLQQHGNASGLVSVPASLAGQTQNYDVTISPAIPADQLTKVKPDAWLRGAPNIISGHTITQIPTVLNATTVRVRVQSGAASLAGSGIEVNFTSMVTS